MELIKSLLIKHKSFIMYAVFGVLTTLINMAAYYVCYNMWSWSNMASTAVAWFIAVIFAFVTNKKWVFDSQSMEAKVLLYELFSFFLCRVATGAMDMLIMYVAVDVMHSNEMFWKLASNVLVIIINFIASKLIIFKKGIK